MPKHTKRRFFFFRWCDQYYKPSTLWQGFGCINKVFQHAYALDLNDCKILKQFLQQQMKKHKTKKSNVFNAEEVDDFLSIDRGDDCLNLQVSLVFGVYGCLRCNEIAFLMVENLKFLEDVIKFTFIGQKTSADNFTFLIPMGAGYSPGFIVRSYLQKVGIESGRIFRQYDHKRGKWHAKKVVGKHTIAKYPSMIAEIWV